MDCKNCKKQGCSLAGKSHEMSFECRMYVGKTNADRIRAMTDEKLAEWIAKHNERSAVCPNFGAHDCQASCKKCWLDWLKQEVKE